MQLNELQVDALTEVINIGVGRAATSLSELLQEPIALQVPSVVLCEVTELGERLKSHDIPVDLAVVQDFRGPLAGRAMLAFPRPSGINLGKVLGDIESSDQELSEDLLGILEEVGNIVLNGVLGSIGNITDNILDYSVPKLSQGLVVEQVVAMHIVRSHSEQHRVVLADARFRVNNRDIDGSLILLFDIPSLDSLLKSLLNETIILTR